MSPTRLLLDTGRRDYFVYSRRNAEFAGVDNAGVDLSALYGKGGHCRSSQIGIMGNLNSQI